MFNENSTSPTSLQARIDEEQEKVPSLLEMRDNNVWYVSESIREIHMVITRLFALQTMLENSAD